LAPDTEDMDLVDTFRPLCGPIVHSRIVREKHAGGGGGNSSNHVYKGKSKGYGYIQFEQQESVDKALQLDDTIGIHEQVVKIAPSHIPAVSIVPAGLKSCQSQRRRKGHQKKHETAPATNAKQSSSRRQPE
jgi:RNA recognition motif-containing protein